MNKRNRTSQNAYDLLESLSAADLEKRLKKAMAEVDALRLLARAARARERRSQTKKRLTALQ